MIVKWFKSLFFLYLRDLLSDHLLELNGQVKRCSALVNLWKPTCYAEGILAWTLELEVSLLFAVMAPHCNCRAGLGWGGSDSTFGRVQGHLGAHGATQEAVFGSSVQRRW